MSNMRPPVSRRADIVVQDLEDEVLIYDLKTNKAFCLNQTSAIVYQLCDGNNSVVEISDLMSKKLKTLVSEDIVWLALDQLKKDNLLENGDEFTNYFSGLTRREMVKRVGFASMVALPIVASMIAPTSVSAQSCASGMATCNPSFTCCPGSLCISGMGGPTCGCQCVNPADCLTQTLCPSTVNCNMSGVCAP